MWRVSEIASHICSTLQQLVKETKQIKQEKKDNNTFMKYKHLKKITLDLRLVKKEKEKKKNLILKSKAILNKLWIVCK